MIRLAVAAAIVSALLAAVSPSAGAAACDSNSNTSVGSNQSSFGAGVQQGNTCSAAPTPAPAADTPDGTWHQEALCTETGACAGCGDGGTKVRIWFETTDGDELYSWIGCPDDAAAAPELTRSMVASAFQRIALPPSTFTIQPPGGKTLVNFDTNFFTEKETLYRTVRLLGRRVELRIDVHSYTWHFGDGDSISTTKPGAPFPKLQITHNYLAKDSYRPSLDTTWVADYRVDGGAWQAVPGSVTIAGSPVDLQAIEARPTLVGYGG